MPDDVVVLGVQEQQENGRQEQQQPRVDGTTSEGNNETNNYSSNASAWHHLQLMDRFEQTDPHEQFRSLRKKVMWVSMGSGALLVVTGFINYVYQVQTDIGIIQWLRSQGIVDGGTGIEDHLGSMFFAGLPFLIVGLLFSLILPMCGYVGAKRLNPTLLGCFSCCNFLQSFCGFLGILMMIWVMAGLIPMADHWVQVCDPVAHCCGPKGEFCHQDREHANYMPFDAHKEEFRECLLGAFPHYKSEFHTATRHLRKPECAAAAKIALKCPEIPHHRHGGGRHHGDDDDHHHGGPFHPFRPQHHDDTSRGPWSMDDDWHSMDARPGFTDAELESHLHDFRRRFPGPHDYFHKQHNKDDEKSHFLHPKERKLMSTAATDAEAQRMLWELFSLEKKRSLSAFEGLHFKPHPMFGGGGGRGFDVAGVAKDAAAKVGESNTAKSLVHAVVQPLAEARSNELERLGQRARTISRQQLGAAKAAALEKNVRDGVSSLPLLLTPEARKREAMRKWFDSCDLNPKAINTMHVIADQLPELIGQVEMIVFVRLILMLPMILLSVLASFYGCKLWRKARRGYRPAIFGSSSFAPPHLSQPLASSGGGENTNTTMNYNVNYNPSSSPEAPSAFSAREVRPVPDTRYSSVENNDENNNRANDGGDGTNNSGKAVVA